MFDSDVVEVYNEGHDNWEAAQSMPIALRLFSTAVVGKVFIYNGFCGQSVVTTVKLETNHERRVRFCVRWLFDRKAESIF